MNASISSGAATESCAFAGVTVTLLPSSPRVVAGHVCEPSTDCAS
jgi:hypothetical protein